MRTSLSIPKHAFSDTCNGNKIPPLSVEIKCQSPAAIYPAFAGRGSLLFESVRTHERIGRYSFIAFDPYAEYIVKDGSHRLIHEGVESNPSGNPLRQLKALLAGYRPSPDPQLPPFQGGAAGLLCYDFLHYLERVPATTTDDLKVPDLHFFLFDRVIAFDHMRRQAWAICAPGARWHDTPDAMYDEASAALDAIIERIRTIHQKEDAPRSLYKPQIHQDISQHDYEDMVRQAKEYIAAGDIFQANLSLRLSARLGSITPWQLYKTLRRINPSPFAGYLDMGDYQIAGSSPERLVMVRDGMAELRPIAGTRPRTGDAQSDNAMRSELLLNEKERAEHIMLIDLERNDIGRVCDYGSIHVDELMATEEYSHVIHIVSNVRGRLAPGRDCLDVIKAAFPGGTITGVPKVRCMEIIDELERFRRGPYTGSMGYISFGGSMDLNIIIRTFLIRDGLAYVQAGAGIVADSDPAREYSESLRKAEALVRTLDEAGSAEDSLPEIV